MRRLVVLACLVLAGCGGGASRLSATEYRAKANGACVRVDRELYALLKAGAAQRNRDPVELARRGEAISGRYVKAISALRPPSELDAAHRKLVKDLKRFYTAQRVPEPDAAQVRDATLKQDFRALRLDRCLATVRG